MPPTSDWRAASTADELMRLDRGQFAIEFLRRNTAYNDDYRTTLDRIAAGTLARDLGMEQLAHRWGLTFPACARHACMGGPCNMATRALTPCCCDRPCCRNLPNGSPNRAR